jgi:signal transduction histidine kinase
VVRRDVPISPEAEAIFREREARGLYVPVLMRLLIVALALLFVSTTAPRYALYSAVPMLSALGLINLKFLLLLRRRRRLELVGLTGALLDAVIISTIPLAWYYIVLQGTGTPAQLIKAPLMMLVLTFAVINTTALQPRYPLIIAVTAMIGQVVIYVAAMQHPETVWASDIREVFSGRAYQRGVLFERLVLLAMVGGALAYVAHLARSMARASIEQQTANIMLRHQQAEAMLEGKLDALAEVVAGVSHEMNTPLGALRSNADSTRKAIEKLRSRVDSEDRRVGLLLTTLERMAGLSLQAGDRLAATVATLRRFTHLDEATRQVVDVHEGLDATLALIPAETRGVAEVERRYEGRGAIDCNPAQLNQVFMTVLANAFESIEGEGLVLVSTHGQEQLTIDITDSGRGMGADRLAALFEMAISGERTGRVSAGFGLPACRAIIKRHGGTISATSEIGRGTTVSIVLPAAKAALTNA